MSSRISVKQSLEISQALLFDTPLLLIHLPNTKGMAQLCHPETQIMKSIFFYRKKKKEAEKEKEEREEDEEKIN